ncbi:hypothetical protein BAUCODRAFT_151053 [Baudoinia panamericana UAMH 10762]|uniref:Major facilitator superfamily (MFS) profile domain-containing protein n=1 Tax=Baudoinia panamericana (strain UAMH 10762) TaxID=717646 RepID=M2LF26_BAUPA|nr:uncharacterized protein BAUCODRAFT_151053 [Baudoinia panamericana UAMH 10762]EMC92632.1 hypothetical protein BAUCODRAFT_151053 [Baudoinia panamericana UAMH 10762]
MAEKTEHEHKQDIDEYEWPPGTIRIELLRPTTKGSNIILQPRPTDDPNDPLNWPKKQKWWNFGLTCFYTLMVFAFIDAATPTWGPMADELGFSTEILNDSYAVGCGTLCIGAFILIPFALKYGRRPLYIVSTIVQFALCIWAARIYKTVDLMMVNVWQCFLGAIAEVIVQMTVADVFFVHERGMMNSIYIWVQNLGGYLAPLAAGYITVGQGWRWVWWWCAIFFGLLFLVDLFTYEETKFDHIKASASVPTELLEQARTHTSETVREKNEKDITPAVPDVDIEVGTISEAAARKLSVVQVNPSIPRKTYWQKLAFTTSSPGDWGLFFRHSYQPLQILFTIPAVGYMSLVYGVMLAWSTVMTVTLSTWMLGPPWNFTAAQIGLMSLPPFIGNTLGVLICGPMSDRTILWLSKRNNGVFEPEMRLWVMAPFVPFLPLGAFLYGYGLNNGWSWPVIAVSYAISAFGSAPISSIALTYITDSYTEIVGDALVGVTFTRNALATIFVFALSPWIEGVGMANVYVTIGVIGIAVLLFVFVFIWKGKTFRRMTAKRYRYYAERQFGARTV